jgi:Protein of unknown function (DUF2726)
LADLINSDYETWKAGEYKIGTMHVDFVLADSTTRVLAVIELDDSSHQLPNPIERDHLLTRAYAGPLLPLLRIRAAQSYDLSGLRNQIQSLESVKSAGIEE